MLVDDMKRRMLAAMKAKKPVEKEILGVALGEIQTADARGTPLGDEGALAIVRKLVKSNEETLGVTTNEADKAKLLEELVVLRSLLPQTLDVAGITAALEGVRDALRAAGNDGQATGLAMKHLKAAGAVVNGKDVGEAVKALRA
jgi:uncharacterized protein YqeY